MNYEQICYGCFRDKGSKVPLCPYCGFRTGSEQPANTLPCGTILAGRYMTGKVLGVGGFGATYLAFDIKLEEKCACKEYLPSGMATRTQDRYTLSVIRQENRSAYQEGMDKFLNEARILAKLEHVRGIVSVRNYFKENGTAYFIMRYVEGMSLKDHIKRQGGRLSYEQTIQILFPVMEALHQVHAMELLHRDISPDNICLTRKMEPILLDFGAARSSSADNETKSVILKHGFAPIEQYSAHGNQGPWSDVYAMGATMYNALTGQLPPDAIERMRSDHILKPSELGSDIPPAAERALMKALAVKAEDRFSNMVAFATALQGGRGAAKPEMLRGQAAKMPERLQQKAAGKTAQVPSAPRWLGVKKWLIIGGAACAALILVIVLVVNGRKEKSGWAERISQAEAGSSSQSVDSSGKTPPYETPDVTDQPTPFVTPEATPELTPQEDPDPTPGATEAPAPENTGEDEMFMDQDCGVVFYYTKDGVNLQISDNDEIGAGYKTVILNYENVEIDVIRCGTVLGDAKEALAFFVENFEANGFAVYGEPDQIAEIYNRSFNYTVMNKEDSYAVFYTMDLDDEVLLIAESIEGSQSEEQQKQFVTVANSTFFL